MVCTSFVFYCIEKAVTMEPLLVKHTGYDMYALNLYMFLFAIHTRIDSYDNSFNLCKEMHLSFNHLFGDYKKYALI